MAHCRVVRSLMPSSPSSHEAGQARTAGDPQIVLPLPKPGGRLPAHPHRELPNATRSVLRSGEAWHLLPRDLPQ
jgi:hypothetical protein